MAATSCQSNRFVATLNSHGLEIKRNAITTLQVNIGKRCNQACHHCHVNAGPKRTENMEAATVARLLELLQQASEITTVDITGGAPELNPHFREFVTASRQLGKTVLDRCNLTVLLEPNQETTAAFLAEQQVQIIASLPCYLEDNVNAQRGKSVFSRSIAALEQLNALGYGQADTGLILNLVYNPIGTHLPPAQMQLEAAYREHLQQNFGLVFNNLFTITNMPIKRFAHTLEREGSAEQYMQLLIDSFNMQAAREVMCTQLISIGWDGKIYDCDFNQMLEMPLNFNARTIWDIPAFAALEADIAFAEHCFGCTAGAGSSCTGALLTTGD